jgi:hypothetical protein
MIVSNKDLMKVPLYDVSDPFVNIYIYKYSLKKFYKPEIIFLKIPILYLSMYGLQI